MKDTSRKSTVETGRYIRTVEDQIEIATIDEQELL